MKTLFALAMCLLLMGCAPAQEPTIPPQTQPPETQVLPVFTPVQETLDRTVFSLPERNVHGMLPFGRELLLFSGHGATTLTLHRADTLEVIAQLPLDFQLEATDPSLQFHNGSLSFFDPTSREIRVLDSRLQPVSRIAMPEDMTGTPILSELRTTVYYCISTGLLAWDQESGIHRTIKDMAYASQTVTGLHLNGTILQCRIEDDGQVRTLFLSADTGRLLEERTGEISLMTQDGRFYAQLPDGFQALSLFGTAEDPQLFLPEEDTHWFLPKANAAVTADSQGTLFWYDLDGGVCRGSFSLDVRQRPRGFAWDPTGTVSILACDPADDCDKIYRWQIPQAGIPSDAVSPYGAEDLTVCRAYASQLSETYGLEICIGTDAVAVEPWDYAFRAEIQPQILIRELRQLDQRLSQYPAAALEQTIGHFSSVKLCLVRQITGKSAKGLAAATGIQFQEDGNVYVVIATGPYSEQALYHEWFHVMETHILVSSTALDHWETLNPRSFSYGTPAEKYLQSEGRAFVDTYSMTSAKEDRARIFENAMLPERADLFDPAIMEKKLKRICLGIREAYGLEDEILPWEQYLNP